MQYTAWAIVLMLILGSIALIVTQASKNEYRVSCCAHRRLGCLDVFRACRAGGKVASGWASTCLLCCAANKGATRRPGPLMAPAVSYGVATAGGQLPHGHAGDCGHGAGGAADRGGGLLLKGAPVQEARPCLVRRAGWCCGAALGAERGGGAGGTGGGRYSWPCSLGIESTSLGPGEPCALPSSALKDDGGVALWCGMQVPQGLDAGGGCCSDDGAGGEWCRRAAVVLVVSQWWGSGGSAGQRWGWSGLWSLRSVAPQERPSLLPSSFAGSASPATAAAAAAAAWRPKPGPQLSRRSPLTGPLHHLLAGPRGSGAGSDLHLALPAQRHLLHAPHRLYAGGERLVGWRCSA